MLSWIEFVPSAQYCYAATDISWAEHRQRGGQPLTMPERQAKRPLVYLCFCCKKQQGHQPLRFCKKRIRSDSFYSGWWARNTPVKRIHPKETMNFTCTN